MKISEQKKDYAVFIITLIFAAAVFLIAMLTARSESMPQLIPSNNGEVFSFNDGWYFSDVSGGKEELGTLPQVLSEKSGSISISYRTPENLPNDAVICISSYHKKVEIFIDGEKVYDNGGGLGDRWNITSLSGTEKDSVITIKLSHLNAKSREDIKIPQIIAGNRSVLTGVLIKSNLFPFIFAGFALILSFVALFVLFYLKALKKNLKVTGFLNFILFIVLSAVWIFTDSKISAFMFDDFSVVYHISFASFMLMPVPCILFIKSILSSRNRMFNIFSGLFLINTLACFLLNLLGIVPLYMSIISSHILIGVTIILSLVLFINDLVRHKNKEVIVPLAGMIIFCISAGLSFADFYMNPMLGSNSKFFMLALMIFIMLLLFQFIRAGVRIFRLSVESSIYRKLAVSDTLTDMNSRAAFEIGLASVVKKREKYSSFGFVILDLNNLKRVNDSFGHMAGDELLMKSGECIKEAAGDKGTCYRIGGDEFAVVFKNKTEQDISDFKERLAEIISSVNETSEIKVDLAYGSSFGTGLLSKEAIEVHFKEADFEMYSNKKRMKKKSGQDAQGGTKANE